MNTHPTPPARARQHPLLIAAALAVIVFCAAGTAAIMGWLPSSSGGARNQLTDADRAALAASMQQPGQQAAAGQALAGAYPQTAAAPATAPGDSAPAPAAGTAAYGYSAQGGSASGAGYAGPVQPRPAPAAPAEPIAAPAPKTESKTARVAGTDTGADAGGNWCAHCGNVESVRQITTRAQGSGVGAAGGAILGGLLGNQIGGGHGRQLATVAGAVGGAVMGNQVEGNMKATHSYEIRVRLDDGSLRTFHQKSAPQWRHGDRVRIVKGSLRAA